MRINSHFHILQMFEILSLRVVDHFSHGLMHYVNGFQCIGSLFRVYMLPLTLFEKLGSLFHADLE